MWPIIKKAVNSDLSTPLNTLINNVESIVDTVNTNVGSNADAASSTGSLHAKNKNIIGILDSGVMLRQSIASGSLRFASDNEVSMSSTEWDKVKTIVVMISGIIRVSFDLSVYDSGKGRIYRNGVPIGIERSVSSSGYSTFTEDISCSPGDSIEIWVQSYSSYKVFVKNFRIYFDIVSTPIYGVVLL